MKVIYALADPTDGAVRYIGQTTSLRRRMWGHKSRMDDQTRHLARGLDYAGHGRYDIQPLYVWLQGVFDSHGGPEVRILPTDTHTSERDWITAAKGLGWPLFNVAPGEQ